MKKAIISKNDKTTKPRSVIDGSSSGKKGTGVENLDCVVYISKNNETKILVVNDMFDVTKCKELIGLLTLEEKFKAYDVCTRCLRRITYRARYQVRPSQKKDAAYYNLLLSVIKILNSRRDFGKLNDLKNLIAADIANSNRKQYSTAKSKKIHAGLENF